ncbi:MAG: hypothetical protein WCW26_02315 [Candidatus Buchananbacteria bacterium]
MPPANSQPIPVSSFKLKASYWYVTHKLQLKKLLVIFLILLSVIFYGYAIYKAIMILAVQDKQYRQDLNYLTTQQIDYSYFHQVNKPKNIEILSFDTAGGREDRYDFIAKVFNPNTNFFGDQVYLQLVSEGRVVAEKTGFIFPGQEKYFAFFGQTVSDPANIAINIAKVDWKRVHDFEIFAEPRMKFEVTDVEYKPAEDLKIRGELSVSALNFKITNNSAYSFWHVGVFIALQSGDQTVGGSYTVLDQFRSGETRNIQMSWYDPLPSVSDYVIIPEVDILDSAAYMPVN